MLACAIRAAQRCAGGSTAAGLASRTQQRWLSVAAVAENAGHPAGVPRALGRRPVLRVVVGAEEEPRKPGRVPVRKTFHRWTSTAGPGFPSDGAAAPSPSAGAPRNALRLRNEFANVAA